jgi:hypothetical protein
MCDDDDRQHDQLREISRRLIVFFRSILVAAYGTTSVHGGDLG